MNTHRTCDGQSRRDFIRVGALSMTGLSLSSYMQMASAGQVSSTAKAQSAIFIDLAGGPSHIDSFDPKPEGKQEIRGKFAAIETNVSGIRISEHLPKLAKCADKYAILRGVSHTLAAHNLGSEYINTGSRPLASLEYPGYGAVISKERPVSPELPPFVAIPRSNQRSGYLGIQYGPMNTGSTPTVGKPFGVRGITLQNGLTVEQIQRRHGLLSDLDKTFEQIEKDHQLLTGLNRFNEKAFDMITSSQARMAFDVSKEDPSFAAQFDNEPFSQSCLLAVRLIASGVRFVSIQLNGWDTHSDNFIKLSTQLLPKLDAGLSALYCGLDQRGLLSSTAVMCTGEFGRTPKINERTADGGRDHYPRCMFMLMAGGGIKGGQVVGESDADGAAPKSDAIRPDDVAASFYHCLGIDPKMEYHTETGRPITLVRDGNVIPQLFS